MPFSKLFKKRNSLQEAKTSSGVGGSLPKDTLVAKPSDKTSIDTDEKLSVSVTDKPKDNDVNETIKVVVDENVPENIKDPEDNIASRKTSSLPVEDVQAGQIDEKTNDMKTIQYNSRSSSFKELTSQPKLQQRTRRRKCESETAASDITDSDEGFEERFIQLREKDLETVIGRCVNKLLQDSIATAVRNINVENLYEEVRKSISSRNNSESSESSERAETTERKQDANSVAGVDLASDEAVKSSSEESEVFKVPGDDCDSIIRKDESSDRINNCLQQESVDSNSKRLNSTHLHTKLEEKSTNLSAESCDDSCLQSTSDVNCKDVNILPPESFIKKETAYKELKCSSDSNSDVPFRTTLAEGKACEEPNDFLSVTETRQGDQVNLTPSSTSDVDVSSTEYKVEQFESVGEAKLTSTVESLDNTRPNVEYKTEQSEVNRSSTVPTHEINSFTKSKSGQSSSILNCEESNESHGSIEINISNEKLEKNQPQPETTSEEATTPFKKTSSGNQLPCKEPSTLSSELVENMSVEDITPEEMTKDPSSGLRRTQETDTDTSAEDEVQIRVADIDLIRMSSDDASECKVETNATLATTITEDVCDLGENLPQQPPTTEEEKKVNWKVGYLHVKLPHKSRGKGQLKAWKKRCVAIQLDEFANDPNYPCLMISLYSGESGNAKKHGASFWKSVSSQKAIVYRSSSSSRAYAFTVADDKMPIIHLATDSESASQEWMAAIRAILWPPSPFMELEKMLNGSEFDISLIDNDFAYRAGLLGMYGYLTITPKKLILVHPNQGYVIQEWYLNTVDKFELMQQTKIEDVHKVLAMTTCSDSSTGRGEILIYCREAVSLLQSLASTIHQILTHHSNQEGGKYQKELEEMAEWFLPPTILEDYYKVPTRQVKSLLDIPNFIFDKPLTPVATLACTRGVSMEAQLKPILETSNSTRTSQDSGISAGTDDFLNCSLTSFMVGGGPFSGKSSDSELSDSYTPPLSPVTKVKHEGKRKENPLPITG